MDAGARMLEVGTGTGWFPLLCKVDGPRCEALEISPQSINVAMELGEQAGIVPGIQLGNVEDMDTGMGQYDLIVSSSVFEHVENWYDALLFYSWLTDLLRYRFRIMVQGLEIMKLGIDFDQFRYPQPRRVLRDIGFKTVLDPVNLLEPGSVTCLKRSVLVAAKQSRAVRHLAPAFTEAANLVCTKCAPPVRWEDRRQ